jgi:hypothetical protein
MSTLKVHLKVAINLCAGVPVFPEYWEETKQVAAIIDARPSEEKERNKGNPYIRSFPHFVETHRRLRKLPERVQALGQDTHDGLSHAASRYRTLVEDWFRDLVKECGFKTEYEIACPWYQGMVTEPVSKSSQQTKTA